ncbi:MAG: type IA DNA topoisomerase [Thermoproteus sp.]|nr:type IA DNA topoisomerase [Thermoproteus sp.]
MLVVAEKRSVAQAVAGILGGAYKQFRVAGIPAYSFKYKGAAAVSLGLSGHIMDFDFPDPLNSWGRVAPSSLFEATPLLTPRDEALRYLFALKALGGRHDIIYLALDADPEGEAIAYEAALAVRIVNPRARFYRVRFNAVTRRDVLQAFERPGELDLKTVEKVFVRMASDLTIGAAFTRLLTLSVRAADPKALPFGGFLSYGPCQTPVLGLVASRELERASFKPEKYYVVKAVVEAGGAKFAARSRPYKAREEAERDLKAARASRGVVAEASYSEVEVKPPVPLETVELERRASRWLNIRAKAALDIAEELYRRGYISYPRTETTIYPPSLDLREALEELRRTDFAEYAERLLRGPLKPTRGRSDDGAHPPIYPTKGASKSEVERRLGARAWRIYELVVRHFLATLSPPAVVERQRIAVSFGPLALSAEGRRILRRGYWEIYPWEEEEEEPLPRLRAGQEARMASAKVEERETEPPPRMTEAELLRLMRRYGIGTDATMQDHIHTNVVRGYMKLAGGRCIPTPLGMSVASALMKYAKPAIDPGVRSKMEAMLQEIAAGRAHPAEVFSQVKGEFASYYKALEDKRAEIAGEIIKALRAEGKRI